MKAAVFQGVRQVDVIDKEEPRILDARDAIVAVELCGLCGSDLHPYRGHEEGIDLGTTMGHEFTGRVLEVGADVRQFVPGDSVISPFSTSCGTCPPCLRGLSSRCENGALFGWVESGHGVEGAQTESVRVPFADSTLLPRPDSVSTLDALLLGDVATTGTFIARRAKVGPDQTVAVLGLGAVGLSSVIECVSRGAEVLALDAVDDRLERARLLGATPIRVSMNSHGEVDLPAVLTEVRALGREDVSVVLEAVGSPGATRLAYALLRPGGILSIAGVHTQPFAITPSDAYDKNLTLMIGRCPVRSLLPTLLQEQAEKPKPFADIVTHQVSLLDATEAYRMFDARQDGCIKLVFDPQKT